MVLLKGFLLVFLASLLQGTFILPMTLVRRWSWEYTWATFSLLGMFILNWSIALVLIPNIVSVYTNSPARDLAVLALFGAGWGVGALLFGMGMERLGMSLGYPVIMGLIAALGAVIPLLVFFPQTLITAKGLVLLAGTTLVIFGIALCSMAGSRRASGETARVRTGDFRTGLLLSIFAGIFSCLPNVGAAYSGNVTRAAAALGVSGASSGNTVWALLFTSGFVVNFAYCLFLMAKRKTTSVYWSSEMPRNLALSAAMALMWIASFYLYGAGTAKLGRWGVIVGWPLFISLSILTGNMWGLWRGEWKGSPAAARRLLNRGLLTLIVAVIVVALSNRF
jgi:L-rhamnose-H+ transport protein